MNVSKFAAAGLLLAFGGLFGQAHAQGTPAAKAAVKIDEMIALSQAISGGTNDSGDTGWSTC